MRNAASSAASALSGVVGGVGDLTRSSWCGWLDDWCGHRRQLAAQFDNGVVEHGLRQGGDPHLCRHLLEEVRVLAQEVAHVLTALPEAHIAVGEPRATLVDDVGVDTHVEHAPGVRDALVVEDVELCGTERWRHLVLDNLD